jgi:hypothetical protein
MTTAAAIDRLVHHSVIVELNIPSYRMEEAKKNRDHLSMERRERSSNNYRELWLSLTGKSS